MSCNFQSLDTLGIRDLWTPNADLSEFASFEKIYASDIIHKAKVEVDETGTVAAAVTGILGTRSTSSPPQPLKLVFDKPFIFLIRHKQTKTTLFAGLIRNAP